MKKISLAAAVLLAACINNVWAASPLPSFDKDAVTVHPYNRTGEQELVEGRGGEQYRPGNTGTEAVPAFYVREIKLTGFELPDRLGELHSLLASYSHRSLNQEQLRQLTAEVTDYARRCGFTVAQAVLPPQEVSGGVLELRVYVASFDRIALTENSSRVADRVLQKYLSPLQSGATITDKKLERTLNALNDLPGVIARGELYPGSRPATTGLNITVLRRPVWNNYVFADNGGSRTSGRYRYGFHTELNNPGQQGDKLSLSGMLSNNHSKNYGVSYEAPLGSRGSRVGLGWSRSSYDLGTIDGFFNPTGESEGLSVYGLTPVYRDKSKRVTAIYGYDRRKITDDIDFVIPLYKSSYTKHADVFHAGLAASEYLPNRFTSGSLIYWYGDIDTDGSDYNDGGYHKLTADFSHVRYWQDWNLRFEAHGQLASCDLDGSERFYLGGLNGVRAYPASETSGDVGYTATMELRRATGIEGLEAAVFVDVGEVQRFKSAGKHRKLAGWGLGLRYSKPNDWHAQLDYARKIDGEPYVSEDHDHDGRLWFQIYKLF